MLGAVTDPDADAILPTLVVHRRKRLAEAADTDARPIGVAVAADSLQRSLEHAALGQFTLRWMAGQPTDSNRGRIYYYPYDGPVGAHHDEIDYPQLPAHLRDSRVDLLLAFDPVISRLLQARDRWAHKAVPVVGALHSIHASWLSTEVLLQTLGCCMTAFDAIISPSQCGVAAFTHLMRAAQAWCSTRGIACCTQLPYFAVIPYGIDVKSFQDTDMRACRTALALPADRCIILSLGRFSKQEKADLLPLLLTFNTVLARGHSVTLILGGSTDAMTHDYEQELQRMTQTLGIAQHVLFKPNLSEQDKRRLYGAADIYVAPTDNIQETYGLTLVEAMAAGLPIVASDWNGYREIVRHTETGFLIPTLWTQNLGEGEHVQALVEGWYGYGRRDMHESVVLDMAKLIETIEALVASPILRRTMGARAQQICAQQYDQSQQGTQLTQLLHQQLDHARRTPWQAPAHLLFTDDVAARFAHYATDLLQDDTVVARGPQAAPDGVLLTTLKLAQAASRQERTLTHAILAMLDGPLAAAEVIARMRQQHGHMSDHSIRLRILRLAKYGILSLRKLEFV